MLTKVLYLEIYGIAGQCSIWFRGPISTVQEFSPFCSFLFFSTAVLFAQI